MHNQNRRGIPIMTEFPIDTVAAPPTGGTPTTTAVARRDPGTVPADIIERFPALDPEMAGEMTELLAENFREGENLSVSNLTRVKVPSGDGAAMFSVVDGDDTTAEKLLKGVIVAWQERKNYWESAEVTGAAPDCFSRDGVTGIGLYAKDSEGNPSGLCVDCPMGQWNDGPNGERIPPACKDQTAVLLMVEGEAFPWFVQVPRTSLKALKNYRATLFKRLKGVAQVVTELTLVKVKKEGVPAFYTIVFTQGEDLGKAAKQVAIEVGNLMLPILNSVATQAAAEEVAAETGGVNGSGTVAAEAGISLDDDEVVTTA
jgi:hypothetical protein